MWIVFALLAALASASVVTLSKAAIKDVPPSLVFAIEAVLILVVSWGTVLFQDLLPDIAKIERKTWLVLVVAGVLTAVSSTDAQLTLETSIEGLNLKEFFLLLSSTGLAYRRCELVKVNGAQIDIRFVSTKGSTKKKSSSRGDSEMATA